MSRTSKARKARLARDTRRANLARSIDLAWRSLRTHLVDSVDVPKKKINERGNEEWNARCVREYAEIIYTTSVELHELAKKDFPVHFEDLKADGSNRK
jgi:hypothetical protein